MLEIRYWRKCTAVNNVLHGCEFLGFQYITKEELLIKSKIFGEIFSYLLDITKNDICAL